jgi:hypothetical protein
LASCWINRKAPVTRKKQRERQREREREREREELANTRIYRPYFGDLKELIKNKKKRRKESAYMILYFSHTNMQKQTLL